MTKIASRYFGRCVRWGKWVPKGERAHWEEGKGAWRPDWHEDHRKTTRRQSKTGRSHGTKPAVIVVFIVTVALVAGLAVPPYLSLKSSQHSQLSAASRSTIIIATTTQRAKWLASTTRVISWSEAPQHVGEYVTVEGRVVQTYFDTSDGTVFLNFHDPPQGYFFALIFANDTVSFLSGTSFFYPLSFYFYHLEVRITGTIQVYKGSPGIIVHSPSQIEVAYQGFNYP